MTKKKPKGWKTFDALEIERLRADVTRSTAGYLRTLEPDQTPPELTRALNAAVEAYQDEEDG